MGRLSLGVPWLVGVLWLGGCSSNEAAAVAATGELSVVLGAGNSCAATIRSVDLAVSPGEFEPVSLVVEGVNSLPLSTKITLPPGGGEVYTVAATFHLQTGDGKASSVPLSTRVPAGTTGRIVMSMPCVCIGSHCPDETHCAQLPEGSGKTQCLAADLCGNGQCEGNESAQNCPADCASGCGDKVCAPGEESCSSCPSDCGTCCGDGTCAQGEGCQTCPEDCGVCAVCGDKICQQGEGASCGDCAAGCGDGACSAQEKQLGNCPADCGAICGNKVCEQGESCSSCAKDCGVCALCGDGVCSVGETCGNCPSDCVCSCGNGTCDGGETCGACAKDCGLCKTCGDGQCSAGETCSSCPGDCLAQSCGDGVCSCNEDHQSCSQDCSTTCGNGACDGAESHASCPADCVAVCGDSVCDAGEAVLLCPECEGAGGASGASGQGGGGGQSGAGGKSGAGGAAGQGGASGSAGAPCVSAPEVCDGKDNDCDGKIDEDDPGGGKSCDVKMQVGECARGTLHCVGGKISCQQNAVASAEVCDGKDNDCDGKVDNGPFADQTGAYCETGAPGLCSVGEWVCSGGALACVQTVDSSPETCNGLDDDCDGQVDEEAAGVGDECVVSGVPASSPCAQGKTICSSGALSCQQVVLAADEECDGVDNDCDGQIDNNLTLDPACTVPGAKGLCATGAPQCVKGALSCKQTVQPKAETCNSKDEDCDGVVDNGDPNVLCAITGGNVTAWKCTSGACSLATCAAGFDDIDGVVKNGCECATDTNATSCAKAATVAVALKSSKKLTGVVSSASGSDWFKVQFAASAAGAAWHPKLVLGGTYAAEYIMDVQSACGTDFSCNADGTGTEAGKGITTWELDYSSYKAGAGCCADTIQPRPTQVWVRVRRRKADAPTCHPFEVTASNP